MPLVPFLPRRAALFELAQLVGLEALRRYFRLVTEGDELLPQSGPAVVVANHSGVSGLDALMLRHEIGRITGRDARILAHRAWFRAPTGRRSLPGGLGLVEARLPTAVSVLRAGSILIVFPEAEQGNFKPTREAYRLRPFRPAFVKMAAAAGAPVIATAVTGAEESTITLASVDLPPDAQLRTLPLPLNLLPLPSRWNIRFIERRSALTGARAGDRDAIEAEALAVQQRVQQGLDRFTEG